MNPDQKAKKRVDIMFDSIIRQFPDLDELQLRFAISDGFTEITLNRIDEDITTDKKEYTVEYWFQNRDDYDFNQVTVEADSTQDAIEKVKSSGGYDKSLNRLIKTPRNAKSFSIIDNE